VARSIWSGSISFGLVSVPVKMYSATSSKELKFHFLHKVDGDLNPIGYDKVDKETGESVPAEEIVRGYEIHKGVFVEVDDEDLDRLDIELTHAIDICDFVDLEEIDPVYFRSAYYLGPSDGAEKPYKLLFEALEQTGKVGIAKIVIRNKQHLACLRTYEDLLMIETMYYPDEVRPPDEIAELGKVKVRDAEVEMAKTLVENLGEPFDPTKYTDTYRKELLDLIRAKAEGQELPEPEEHEAEVIDLMTALRESVERTKKTRTTRKTGSTSRKSSKSPKSSKASKSSRGGRKKASSRK
jgi:DNA end-binding protein Ku